GYAVDAVAQLAWIGGARVIYWGDLDSHGFAILNRLRTHLPDVESVLMHEATLLAHEDLWVPEPKPSSGTFRELTGSETRALERIRAEGDVRLAQERSAWVTAGGRLTAAVGGQRWGRRREGTGLQAGDRTEWGRRRPIGRAGDWPRCVWRSWCAGACSTSRCRSR